MENGRESGKKKKKEGKGEKKILDSRSNDSWEKRERVYMQCVISNSLWGYGALHKSLYATGDVDPDKAKEVVFVLEAWPPQWKFPHQKGTS